MKFLVDEEGKKALIGLLDVALKSGGVQNMDHVNEVARSIEMIPEEKPKEDTEK